MPFFSIIRGNEHQGTPPEAIMKAMEVFVSKSLEQGTVLTTGGLAPSAAGTRIAIRGGKLVTTDGPFTESKEVVGGYAVLAAQTREEAVRATTEFLQLHLDHWPGWEGECELRELVFLAP